MIIKANHATTYLVPTTMVDLVKINSPPQPPNSCTTSWMKPGICTFIKLRVSLRTTHKKKFYFKGMSTIYLQQQARNFRTKIHLFTYHNFIEYLLCARYHARCCGYSDEDTVTQSLPSQASRKLIMQREQMHLLICLLSQKCSHHLIHLINEHLLNTNLLR